MLPFTLAASPDPSSERLGGVLVLAGGGARGAYEAGIVEGLRRKANVSDGQPLPCIDVVCGTSIGALNGWFVATGQYSQLASLWANIASEQVFAVKPRFAATVDPHAFVLTKIIQGLSLVRGLTTNVRGILDGQRIQRWVDAHVDPSVPMIVPYVFTTTNLDRQRAEIFYRVPHELTEEQFAAALTRLHTAVGPNVAVRLATDELLRPALRASAAIPVLFDPVELPAMNGGQDRYLDGGIADNTPIDVGRSLARAVYTVMVDPDAAVREKYDSALAIGIGAFGIAQSRILEASLRAAYYETQGERLFGTVTMTDAQRRFYSSILDADLFFVRPADALPVETVEFDRQEKINAAYAIGVADGARDWTPYVPAESN
jgi:predicted acylesterase/phospholipase RssA